MYLNDYKVGMEFPLEPISLSKEEIISFAKVFDPRPIHVDEEEAKKSRFGGIIASGFHATSACWGQYVHLKHDEKGVIAGKGIQDLKWHKPVYPDMMLYGVVTITKIVPYDDGSKGTVFFEMVVKDEKDELVMIMNSSSLIAASEDVE
ncbi:MaoC family dehydratase N-terminal domain-containing protein [Peptoniphilus sp. KCTC 25270]|uniref:MaoC/PaaZ C-terminal domain-containing protein n=1 Tax=Peptoniphilus sp. KCTC 25270 TaxID=2897414 RepID=UPI001E420A89|nr:MaoC/PaaZ C-terminal domain-containing protein [Peptoniphilus sp. KCTC 25270]MCD1147801.1 MaoC family dehydratase N-terminal domain-containing protein [Peptoniphilus sp. KCTC 25270]